MNDMQRDSVGHPAVPGDLAFFKLYGERMMLAGVVTRVLADGRAQSAQTFDGEAHYLLIGVQEITIMPQSQPQFDFASAERALRRRGARRFRSIDTVTKFMMRYLTADDGTCRYCTALSKDPQATGVHRAGCERAPSGSGSEFLR